jgi:Brp/Blh family beta-carotene 15,15'-monooxygenase
MLLPLVFAPQLYRQVAESICQLFSDSPSELPWINAVTLRAIVLGCVLFLGFIEALLANRSSATFLLNASESCLLFVAFISLPPLPAIGFYFIFWHGLRHVLRLMKTERLSLSLFAWRSAPATLAALAMLIFLGFAISRHHPNPRFIGVYLALIATLTVPHSAVVAWMDRREKLY